MMNEAQKDYFLWKNHFQIEKQQYLLRHPVNETIYWFDIYVKVLGNNNSYFIIAIQIYFKNNFFILKLSFNNKGNSHFQEIR